MENIQDKNIEILFEPIKHEYTVNGEKAKISVTGIVEKQVTGNEYFSVPSDVLQRAADRGTEIHADLEYFVGKGTAPKTKACQNFANYIKANGWTIESPLCEFKMAIRWTAQNDKKIQSFILSGTADLLCKLNGKWVVIDHKTTSSVHEESVRWQMSLLDFMARQLSGCIINGVLFDYIPAEELYVFHFDKSDVFKPIKVEKEDVFVIGIVKSLEKKYGIEYLLKAFKLLKDENLDRKILLKIGGSGKGLNKLEELHLRMLRKLSAVLMLQYSHL